MTEKLTVDEFAAQVGPKLESMQSSLHGMIPEVGGTMLFAYLYVKRGAQSIHMPVLFEFWRERPGLVDAGIPIGFCTEWERSVASQRGVQASVKSRFGRTYRCVGSTMSAVGQVFAQWVEARRQQDLPQPLFSFNRVPEES